MRADDGIKRKDCRYRKGAAVLAVLAAALLLFRDARSASEAVSRGLRLCAETMIPSLFPFMVVSELIVRTGAGRVLSALFSPLLRPLFGLSDRGVCALVMGWLCGFPVGAKTAADYYCRGEMNARELNHVLCFCNVPSSAYLVGAVGVSLFGSAAVGYALLGTALASAAVIGVMLRFVLPRRVYVTNSVNADHTDPVGSSLLPSAVASAAGSMLNVCATVVLFSALIGTLTACLAPPGMNEAASAMIYGLFELSTGINGAAEVSNVHTAILLCAGMVGWGGLSVHCQIMAVCDNCPLSLSMFWCSRVLGALLTCGGMWLCLRTGVLSLDTVSMLPLDAPSVVSCNGARRVWVTVCAATFGAALLRRRSRGKKEEYTLGKK